MLNVAINLKDKSLQLGIKEIIKQIFSGTYSNIVFIDDVDDQAVISTVDIIIKSYTSGTERICSPIMVYRKPQSLIIGVHEGFNAPLAPPSLHCQKNRVLIQKKDSVEKVIEMITTAWLSSQNCASVQCKRMCTACPRITLTAKEQKVMSGLYHGLSLDVIADIESIHYKTVSNYKRRIMNKCNLHSNMELTAFMKAWDHSLSSKFFGNHDVMALIRY